MKRFRKWISTLMSVVMLLCCTACDLPETPSQNAKPAERPAVTVAQQETTQTTTTVDNSFADKEARIEYPRPTGEQNISVGSKGDDVRWVQAALNKTLDAGIDVDGDFGNTTKKYVKAFQEQAGLTSDGSVGPKTIEKLAAVASGKESIVIVTTEKTTKVRTTTTTTRTTKATKENNSYVQQTTKPKVASSSNNKGGSYVCNTNTGKFHKSGCSSVSQMNESNKLFVSSRDEALKLGYDPCKRCHP